jgi:hypothetical protein
MRRKGWEGEEGVVGGRRKGRYALSMLNVTNIILEKLTYCSRCFNFVVQVLVQYKFM